MSLYLGLRWSIGARGNFRPLTVSRGDRGRIGRGLTSTTDVSGRAPASLGGFRENSGMFATLIAFTIDANGMIESDVDVGYEAVLKLAAM